MIIRIATAILMTFALTLATADETKAQDGLDEAKVVAITMHADWCGTCQDLNPKVDNVKPYFEDEGVLFTKFDFTDDYTIHQTRLMANWIGIGELFTKSQERGATGYMILIDPDTKEEIGRITNQKDEQEIRQTIAALLD